MGWIVLFFVTILILEICQELMASLKLAYEIRKLRWEIRRLVASTQREEAEARNRTRIDSFRRR